MKEWKTGNFQQTCKKSREKRSQVQKIKIWNVPCWPKWLHNSFSKRRVMWCNRHNYMMKNVKLCKVTVFSCVCVSSIISSLFSFLSLFISVSLCLRASVSVWCCVVLVLCGVVVVCGVCGVARWKPPRVDPNTLRLSIQNVPVCTGNTSTCIKHVDVVPRHLETFWITAVFQRAATHTPHTPQKWPT